jgi:thiol-disulfide isomerase/thioredoxin
MIEQAINKIFNNKYLFFVSSLFLFLIVSCLPLIGFNWAILITLISYCLAAFFALHFSNAVTNRYFPLLIIAAPPFFIQGFIHLCSFTDTLVSLPIFLSYFAGMLFGTIIFFVTKKAVKILLSILVIAFGVFMFISGYQFWMNKIAFGTYFLAVNESFLPDSNFRDINGNFLPGSEWKDKIEILDFWNTSCGICFKEFPITEQKKEFYRANPRIRFYAVNVPLKRDSVGQGKAIFTALKLNIPFLILSDQKQSSRYGISAFPTVLVVYNNRIYYRGDIEHIDDVVANLLKLK